MKYNIIQEEGGIDIQISRKIIFYGLFCFFVFLNFPIQSVAEEITQTPATDVVNAAEMNQEVETSEDKFQNDVELGEQQGTSEGLNTESQESVIVDTPVESQQQNSSPAVVAQQEQAPPILAAVFKSTDRYFKVIDSQVAIYDNSTGKLIPVAYLNQDQVYPRVSDWGDWHQVKFGNGYGYVYKGSTAPVDSSGLKNLNQGQVNLNQYFIPKENLAVYDNSTGSLVPFATLVANKRYPILSVDGDWYKIDVSGRIGYVYIPATTRPFIASDRFFQVNKDNLGIFDNSSGKLIQVASLIKGQVFPRIADWGDWHQVKFGNGFGYVYAGDTSPAGSSGIKNLNPGLGNQYLTFIPKEDLTVYDNTTGRLVPFATLAANKKYPIISDDGDWYKIDVSGRIGYVYKPATTRSFESTDRFFQVNKEDLGIYDNSTGKLILVANLTKGQVYPRVADFGDWHQVRYGSGFGYVYKGDTSPASSDSIKNINSGHTSQNQTFISDNNIVVYDNSSGSLVSFASLIAKKQYPYISDIGDWYQVDISGRIGYVYKGSTSRPFKESDRYFTVKEDNLGVYDNSSGSLVLVGDLIKGETYLRIGDIGDWHQIRFGNRFGYVLESATKVADNVALNNENKTFIAKYNYSFKGLENIKVYDKTSKSSVQFGTIKKDTLYHAIGFANDWYQVDFSGRIGYVHSDDVQAISGLSIYGKVIVLDAGHGGTDNGASGQYNLEKTLTLQTVNQLAHLLREAGATVILTRESDTYLSLPQRVEKSNKFNPDVFISVHYNAFTNSSVNGIETYYYSQTKDLTLANEVHQSIMDQVSLSDRGVRYGNFHVIRENSHTAILLELGYISNSQEEMIVSTTAYQKQAALGIVNGLKKYFETSR